MKPEARLWQSMKSRMLLPADRMDRVENSVAHGAPDTNGCLAGEDVWIELKAPTEPKRGTTPLMTSNGNHPLLESQINWFIRQRRAGGIAFILVRTDHRMMLIDGTEYAEAFNSWTVERMMIHSIFVCDVPTIGNEWSMLRNVLFTASRHHRLSGHARAQTLLDDMERKGLAGHHRPR